jgi:hypothetical protein
MVLEKLSLAALSKEKMKLLSGGVPGASGPGSYCQTCYHSNGTVTNCVGYASDQWVQSNNNGAGGYEYRGIYHYNSPCQ